jgi:DNA mismatch repair protein PMS2
MLFFDHRNLKVLWLQSKLKESTLFKKRQIFSFRACRSAIMIGDELSHLKMVQIVQRMTYMQHPWACPHGRPTLRHLCSIH